jgi:mono/diheme cytochrome c family protein
MMKKWIERVAILGCAVLALSAAPAKAEAQTHEVQLNHQQSQTLTFEGPAIQTLTTLPRSKRELRKLVTDSRTVEEHPDLAEYYLSEANRLQTETTTYEKYARAFGDTDSLDAPDHFSIGRNARFYYLVAKDHQKRAQDANVMAALHAQAAQQEGCFTCHKLNGRGGKLGPDLAAEGTRGRSDAWLIGHFKDPKTLSPTSVMPAFSSLTDRQLQMLAAFLQSQKVK